MRNNRMKLGWLVGGAMLASVGLAACGGGEAGRAGETEQSGAQPSAAVPGAPQTPDPGREVITVEMLTDDEGNNLFRPADIKAHQGDVLRFTLVSGVHNVNFVPDSNPGKTELPPASPLLQLPGQTHDIKVTFAPGKYYFHCDPHALLGMIGWLEVEPQD